MATVLVIDDNETVRDGVSTTIHRMGCRVLGASSGEEGLHAFRQEPGGVDLVITDLRMTPVDGMEVLRQVMAEDPEAVVIMITGHGSVESAVEAMRIGAWDFIEKPFSVDLLRSKVEKALEAVKQRREGVRLRRENEYLRDELAARGADEHQLIGSSPAMKELLATLQKVARVDSTVHIVGESGTGKELVANALHAMSPRAQGPLIKVNCSAIPDNLLESELFGHEKGAFTDAHKRRIGRFELADKGTLFLDEIGDISPQMQVKLLRVLQERSFERVGGEQSLQVDVRVVTATNKRLEEEVEAGRFREDLYYRLMIIPLQIPPLRERLEDLPELVEHFVARLSRRTRASATRFSAQALEVLRAHNWPGNVRELENAVEQSLVFADGAEVMPEDLPLALRARETGTAAWMPDDDRPLPEQLERMEARLIQRALDKAQGVKAEAARLLGIKTPALYYKLEKYGLGEEETATSEI